MSSLSDRFILRAGVAWLLGCALLSAPTAAGLPCLSPMALPVQDADEDDPADYDDGEEESQMRWAPDLGEALERSADEPRPVLICFNEASEIGDEILDLIYTKKKFTDAAEPFFAVMCSAEEHEQIVVEEAGIKRKICQRFGHISCEEHQLARTTALEVILDEKDTISPQHVILMPDSTMLHRRAYDILATDLLNLMSWTVRACGLDPEGYRPPSEREQKRWIEGKLKEAKKETFKTRTRRVLEEILELGTPYAYELVHQYILKGDDEMLRGELINLLDAPGNYMVLDTMTKAIKDRKNYVALAAIDGLGRMKFPGSALDLKKQLRTHARGQAHGRVLQAYASCGRDDPAVLADVLKEAKQHDTTLRSYAILALRHFSTTPNTIAALDRAMTDQIVRVRAAAVWAIGMGRLVDAKPGLLGLKSTERVVDLREMIDRAIVRLDDPRAENPKYADPDEITVLPFTSLIEDYVPLQEGRF